jgi:ATP-dependent helicase/nuclease subunit A
MRQRLQEWLEQFSHKPLDELTAELIARGISPQGALEKREALQNLYRQMLEAAARCRSAPSTAGLPRCWARPRWRCCSSKGLPAHFELLEDDAEAVREVWPPFLHAVADQRQPARRLRSRGGPPWPIANAQGAGGGAGQAGGV